MQSSGDQMVLGALCLGRSQRPHAQNLGPIPSFRMTGGEEVNQQGCHAFCKGVAFFSIGD